MQITTHLAEQIAWNLSQQYSSPLAFVHAHDQIYYSTLPLHSKDLHVPASPVTQLIQGIWSQNPEMARAILRKRIYSTVTPTEMCWGMVKVAAKCLTPNITPFNHQIPVELRYQEVKWETSITEPFDHDKLLNSLWNRPTPPETDQDFLEIATKLIPPMQSGALYTRDRPVGCLLVLPGTKPQILAWAINKNANNRTLHAEVNLIQAFHSLTDKGLPKGACLYTTLKPCKMCAGMLWHCAEDVRNFHIIYAEDDPGPNARSTVLESGTYQRQRASGAEKDLIDLVLQVQRPRN